MHFGFASLSLLVQVKNSWGAGYGDNGYMMYAKGNHTGGRDIWDDGNLCGIASCAGYPTVGKTDTLHEREGEAGKLKTDDSSVQAGHRGVAEGVCDNSTFPTKLHERQYMGL